MSPRLEPTIRLRVDPTNPGQFFACCGLLELVDRRCGGAEGRFDGGARDRFEIYAPGVDESAYPEIVNGITRCDVANTMTPQQRQRYEELSAMPKREIKASEALERGLKDLDKLRREAPVLLGEPFHLRLDWFVDDRAGGGTFKTWAGQQSVVDIASGMQGCMGGDGWREVPPENLLFRTERTAAVPFYFDSERGGIGSDLDVGFSFDPLKKVDPSASWIVVRPMVELLAFVGLQRFRPAGDRKENRFRYFAWADRLTPDIAAPAACGAIESPGEGVFEFSLLYRTKYLKSFLPATHVARR